MEGSFSIRRTKAPDQIKGILFALLGLSLCAGKVGAQTQIFANNTYQTFSSSGTTSGAATNGTYNLYTAVGQPIAISSATLTQMQAGILSAVSNGIILFDNIPPVVTPTPASTFQADGSLSVSVADNVSVATTYLHYKPITAPASGFDSVAITSTSTSSTAKDYSAAIPAAPAFDAMGLEYYYSAKDGKGNYTRNPAIPGNSYYSSLVVPSLTLPTLPSGAIQSHYRIVTFPDILASNQVDAIYGFTGLTSRPLDGIKDSVQARVFHWNPDKKAYDEYAQGGFTAIERGLGYWILFGAPQTITRTNVQAPPENRKSLKSITLAPGWNQIGNPYPVPISWSDVLAFNTGVDPNNLSKLNLYNGGTSYDSATTALAPFQGGFVKNVSNADISLTIPFQGQTTIGGRVEALGTDLSSDRWNVFLHARQTDVENNLGGFGMHPHALTGPDRFDNYNPPMLFPMPEVNFITPQFPNAEFSNDMVPSQEEFEWSFIVKGEDGKVNELTWNEAITSKTKHLVLYDELTLSALDMLTTDHYQFTQQKNRNFKIYFGEHAMDKIRPGELGMTGPYPNPIADDNTTTFTVAIPESSHEAHVSVQFFNGTGITINSANATIGPGLHQMKYQFSTQQASGIYFYRLVVGQDQTSKVQSGKIVIP